MVVTGGIIATMLMYDWGSVNGQDTVFSGLLLGTIHVA
jgi:hypothetical protein